MPAHRDRLLDRLDALVDLAADRRGLALLPDGRLAPADALAAARAAGLPPPGPAGPRAPGPSPGPSAQGAPGVRQGPPGPWAEGSPVPALPTAADLDAVDLLRALAEAVGLVRARGGRLEATALRPAWARVAPDLRAGLVFAAWCNRVPWAAFLPAVPVAAALAAGRRRVLRLLLDLPAAVDVAVPSLAATVASQLGMAGRGGAAAGPPGAEPMARVLSAALLEPLVALGVAELDPPPPASPVRLRLGPQARVVIGSALVAAGEDVPMAPVGAN